MKILIKFVQEKTVLAVLIIFILGLAAGLAVSAAGKAPGSGGSALAMMSPTSEQPVSGIVPVRGYFKTTENTFFLTGEFKIDEGLGQNMQVIRINDQEVALIGSWDSTRDPGKHEITVTLNRTEQDGRKSPIAQTKLPVSVLLFQ